MSGWVAGISLAISAASATYGAVKQNETANKAKSAANDQRLREEARAKAAAALEAQRILENAQTMKGKQRNLLAGSGVDLNAQGDDLAALTTESTDKLAQRDINTLNSNLGMRIEDAGLRANQIIGAQPSGASIWGAAAGQIGSAALNAYSNVQATDASKNLLNQQYGQLATNSMITGNSSQPYSLLGGTRLKF